MANATRLELPGVLSRLTQPGCYLARSLAATAIA
jgi:hypothetical protein